MTEDELAIQFEKWRHHSVKIAQCHFPYLDTETLDMLYTDCWYSLKAATFKLTHLKAYLEMTLANHVKDYLRDRARSHDLFDRNVRVDNTSETEFTDDLDWISNIPDRRPYETLEDEETAMRVRVVMEQLPKTLALVGEWYYVDEMTENEIAQRLKCTQPNVSLMLMRFRTKFRAAYSIQVAKENNSCLIQW